LICCRDVSLVKSPVIMMMVSDDEQEEIKQ
jgi:hypothetical protein